jgi:hypothetical protein
MESVLQMSPAATNHTERHVLTILAWHAQANGRNAFPSVQRIHRMTSLSPRAIQKALRRLSAKGFIMVDGLASRRSVTYTVDVAACDRARGSHSDAVDREPDSQSASDCERGSQSEAPDGERRSPVREPDSGGRVNHVRETPEPRSPDPSVKGHSERSLKLPRAARDEHRVADAAEQAHEEKNHDPEQRRGIEMLAEVKAKHALDTPMPQRRARTRTM